MCQLPFFGEDVLDVDDYVNIDSHEETGETLSDNDILTLVQETADEQSQGRSSQSDQSDDEPEPPAPVTLTQAKDSVQMLITYFEQNPVGENDNGNETLKNLWSVSRVINDRMSTSLKQRSITHFLSPAK